MHLSQYNYLTFCMHPPSTPQFIVLHLPITTFLILVGGRMPHRHNCLASHYPLAWVYCHAYEIRALHVRTSSLHFCSLLDSYGQRHVESTVANFPFGFMKFLRNVKHDFYISHLLHKVLFLYASIFYKHGKFLFEKIYYLKQIWSSMFSLH